MDLSDGFTKKTIVDLKSVVSLLFAFLLAYCLTSTDVFRGFVILIVWFSIVLSVCCFVCHSDLLSYFLCFLFNGLSLLRLVCFLSLPLGECLLSEASLTQKLTDGADVERFLSSEDFLDRRLDKREKFKRRISGSVEKP